ncbi:hypothetical protein [Mesorhizobium sp. WSM3224]|uniref:hypothetical protein n=1 Tax=Mesorhizobium sp. WSM3224 TaxID=1040986 RepID=UPI0004854014|nr:hypothetical protein [Mesorhizobium sp. WSM3224]
MSASSIDRRGLLIGAMASVPVVGAAAAAFPSGSATPERPCMRVRRLAREMSVPLREWNIELGDGSLMIAHVYPEGEIPDEAGFITHTGSKESPRGKNIRIHFEDTARSAQS